MQNFSFLESPVGGLFEIFSRSNTVAGSMVLHAMFPLRHVLPTGSQVHLLAVLLEFFHIFFRIKFPSLELSRKLFLSLLGGHLVENDSQVLEQILIH
jgi:hypothetical protein